jgi:hypothetical protein
MHVVVAEPWFPSNQRQFVRALHAVGATVSAVGESPIEEFDGELQSWLAAYERVSSVVDQGALAAAVERLHRRLRVDRLEATIEAHILTAAKVRAT